MKTELLYGHNGEYISIAHPNNVDIEYAKAYLSKLSFGNNDKANISIDIKNDKLFIGYATFVENKYDLKHVIVYDDMYKMIEDFDNTIPEFVDYPTFLEISNNYNYFDTYVLNRRKTTTKDIKISKGNLVYIIYKCICRQLYLDTDPVIVAVPENDDYLEYCMSAIKKMVMYPNKWVSKLFSFSTNDRTNSDHAICFKKASLVNYDSKNVIILDKSCDYKIEYNNYYELAKNLVSKEFWDFIEGTMTEDISVIKMSEISNLYLLKNRECFDKKLLVELNNIVERCLKSDAIEKTLFVTVVNKLQFKQVISSDNLNNVLLSIENVSFDNVLGLRQFGKIIQWLAKFKITVYNDTLEKLLSRVYDLEQICSRDIEQYINEIEMVRKDYNNIIGEPLTNYLINEMKSDFERLKEEEMEEINKLKAELDTVNSENSKLNAEIMQLKSRIKDLKGKEERLNQKVENEKKARSTVESDYDNLKAQMEKQLNSSNQDKHIAMQKENHNDVFTSRKPLVITILCLSAVVLVLIGLLLGKLIFGNKKDSGNKPNVSTPTEASTAYNEPSSEATDTDATATDVTEITSSVNTSTDADSSDVEDTFDVEAAFELWENQDYDEVIVLFDDLKDTEIVDLLLRDDVVDEHKEMIGYCLLTELAKNIDDEVDTYEISDIDFYASQAVYETLKNYVYIGDVESYILISITYEDENYLFYFNGRKFKPIEDEMELATDIDADEWLNKTDIEEMIFDNEDYDVHYGNVDIDLFIEVFENIEQY